jgi:hypothetical protein
LVHKIVIDYDGEKKKIVRLSPEEDIQGDEVVVAIGKIDTMTEMVGARGIASDEIFRDIVFGHIKKIPREWIVNETLPSLLRGSHALPVHKYVKSVDEIKDEKLLSVFNKDTVDFLNNVIIKAIKGYEESTFNSLEDIYYGDLSFTNKLHYLVLRSIYDANIEELEEFLIKYFDAFPTRHPAQTILRKLVLIYDKRKYKSTL